VSHTQALYAECAIMLNVVMLSGVASVYSHGLQQNGFNCGQKSFIVPVPKKLNQTFRNVKFFREALQDKKGGPEIPAAYATKLFTVVRLFLLGDYIN
jgi:hypothetical protein